MSVHVVQTTSGPQEVFVDDAVAQPPTWLLAATLWHFVYSSGVTACGQTPQNARPYQYFRPHSPRKLYERAITTLCSKCLRRRPEHGRRTG